MLDILTHHRLSHSPRSALWEIQYEKAFTLINTIGNSEEKSFFIVLHVCRDFLSLNDGKYFKNVP